MLNPTKVDVLYKNTFIHVSSTDDDESIPLMDRFRTLSCDDSVLSRCDTADGSAISRSSTRMGDSYPLVRRYTTGQSTTEKEETDELCILSPLNEASTYSSELDSSPILVTPAVPSGPTSFMIRNIPNRYLPNTVRGDIDRAGFCGKYDFFYMPCDVHNRVNAGYAFINFVHPKFGSDFIQWIHRKQLPRYTSRKVIEVTVAKIQGLKPNVDSLMRSSVVAVLPEDFKPVMLLNGQLTTFAGSVRRQKSKYSPKSC